MSIYQKENNKSIRVETTTNQVYEIPKLKEEQRILLLRTDSENERHDKFILEINTRLAEINILLSEAEKVGIDIK